MADTATEKRTRGDIAVKVLQCETVEDFLASVDEDQTFTLSAPVPGELYYAAVWTAAGGVNKPNITDEGKLQSGVLTNAHIRAFSDAYADFLGDWDAEDYIATKEAAKAEHAKARGAAMGGATARKMSAMEALLKTLISKHSGELDSETLEQVKALNLS